MKIKTSELSGSALRWAVAVCQNVECDEHSVPIWFGSLWPTLEAPREDYAPDEDWSQGGPIIEREGINIRALRKPGHNMDGKWLAAYDHNNTGTMVHWVKRTTWHQHYSVGDTALVAAMRCYVASKLGDEVDVPETLL